MEESFGFNKDIFVIRNYPGGSNATTILCTDGKKTFYRKYAGGDDAEKLWQQILWIDENKERLTLPRIVRREKTSEICFYDMEYISHAVGLVEYAHSMPIEYTWNIIMAVIDRNEKSLYATNIRKADNKTIHRYYKEKVEKNIRMITSNPVFRNIMPYERLVINGKEYNNLPYYCDHVLFEDNLQKIFSHDSYTAIHGDLTFENIICTRDGQGVEDFYIIDPNTGNIHDSPALDFAKLLQSLHGEYEFIKKSTDARIKDNEIYFRYTNSDVFIELYKRYAEWLNSSFDWFALRSIYYHEVIHWLRLLPYKLSNEPDKALAFFAKMLIVMDEVRRLFENEKE